MSMQPGATATGARQRLILVVLAGALVLALALALRPLVLNREKPTAAPTATTTASAAASTTTSTVVLGESDQPLQSTKDPFRPLVSPGVAAATGAPAAASTPSTGPTVQSTVPGAGAGTGTVPGGGATAAEHKVTLLGIVTESGARAARVEVDDTRYTVGEGESFADDYRAVDIGSSCATFESGSSPFTLCKGEAVLK
jgi:hypothetical protein